MEPQYFGHEHPLLFNEEASSWSEAQAPDNCSRCGEAILGSSFSCDDRGFHLHEQCAEAPSELDHPFHRNHPLTLLPHPPADLGYKAGFICNFCGKVGMKFVYHCFCNLDLHIKCALFTYNIAQKTFGELERFGYKDSVVSTENGIEDLCFGCWEPLMDSTYCSLECGFNLHKKCVDLPHEINYPCHPKHPLILQLSVEIFPCVICQKTDRRGFFYCCSPCKFFIHITCLSPSSIIEEKGHQHPFTLFWRQISFVCDACGIEGNCVPYTCSECNLLVHKKCISLPRIIKLMWHRHPLFHTDSFQGHELKKWECVICHLEVNTDYGFYHCSESDCHFIVHVSCVVERKNWYHAIESVNEAEKFRDSGPSIASFIVIERNEDGSEALEIKHISHQHNLMLSHEISEDGKYCGGCTISIWDSFYWCSECRFFLHKKCAEFPKKQHVWFHMCQQLLNLVSDSIFKCICCQQVCNGFAYKCDDCGFLMCLRCVIPDTLICEAHKHPLPFHTKYEGHCNACGTEINQGFKCMVCNYALDGTCFALPHKAPHKCDEHLLTLTYPHDNGNTYSERNFCDICEKYRNPSHWFYYCGICDNSAHPVCVLGRYPFMKLGKMYEALDSEHPHPLTLVKKIHYYPECFMCGDPCRDLALECVDSGCGYVVHWDCFAPPQLRE